MKKRPTSAARAKELRHALIRLIESIDACGAFEIEAGECGYGPLYDACKAARIPLPENFKDWRIFNG
ncbi:hypothetical protein IED13_01150 [Bosea sp. SSUT16]|uniref:Uncharacterized protein n=1 Tax=Bosea spartocytisi TaxID=2773451 RepID=A0A927HYC7_9HYPH|nr:hypothetical protein [Bosea spartocytisi]MBD3844286.1 hypothetical protein [Bosea spartocytisi]MCT4470608.1 hypothetical protein [Bosea spartocytisi]